MWEGYDAYAMTLDGSNLLLYISKALDAGKHHWNSSRHSNANYELHMILQGRCCVDVEEDRFPLEAQQALLIAPGQYHRPSTEPGSFSHFSLSFSLTGVLAQRLLTKIPTCAVFSFPEETARLCAHIFQESAGHRPCRREMLQAQLTQLFLTILRQLEITDDTPPASQSLDSILRTEKIDVFFQNHFASRAAEAQLAEELHLSRRQLARVIRARYGMTFREKLISARMDHAAWLLRTTQMRPCEIAEEVGYSGETGFYQAFRRRFGMTPQQYRRQTLLSQKNSPQN